MKAGYMDNQNTAQPEDTILHAWDPEVPQDDTVMVQPYFIQRHEISAASKLRRRAALKTGHNFFVKFVFAY